LYNENPANPHGNVRNFKTGATTGGNRSRVVAPVVGGTGVNSMPMFPEGGVMIPSDDEEEEVYESSFGMHVSDGRRGEAYSEYQDDGSMRRNTIKDIFETDGNYDNFNDVYYAEEEEVY
jgi:hypothetical protein